MKINGRAIGHQAPPYLIAEMSNNHTLDLNKAFEMVLQAKRCGADAVKIQTYTADSLTIDCDKADFLIPDPLWQGKKYYDLYSEITMPTSWNKLLFEKAEEIGITLFSSPFDEASVNLLEDLNCPAYKIASFEAKDHYFLKQVAATGKPIIISTGISSLQDIEESLTILRDAGARDIAVLHCISSYPSNAEDMNVSVVGELAKLGVPVGLSDHSLEHIAPVLSVAYGASVIEKHFTLRRSDGGPDAAFSIEPDELKELRRQTDQAWKAIGNPNALNEKRPGSHHGRSVYVVQDIRQGEILSPENVRIIRPGFGLEPRHYEDVLGKTANKDLERGTPLTLEVLL